MNVKDIANNSLIGKSRFNSSGLSHTEFTTFNLGELVPFRTLEMLPGQEIHINPFIKIRMAALLYPIFNNINVNVSCFFVPHRLTINKFKEKLTFQDVNGLPVRKLGQKLSNYGLYSKGSFTIPVPIIWKDDPEDPVKNIPCFNGYGLNGELINFSNYFKFEDLGGDQWEVYFNPADGHDVFSHAQGSYNVLVPNDFVKSFSSKPAGTTEVINIVVNGQTLSNANLSILNGYQQIYNNYFRDSNLQTALDDSNRYSDLATDTSYYYLPVGLVRDLTSGFKANSTVGYNDPTKFITVPQSGGPYNVRRAKINGFGFYRLNAALVPVNQERDYFNELFNTTEALSNNLTLPVNLANLFNFREDLGSIASDTGSLGYRIPYDGADTSIPLDGLRSFLSYSHLSEDLLFSGNNYQDFLKMFYNVSNYDKDIPVYVGSYSFPIQIQQVVQTSESTPTSDLGDLGAYSVSADSSGSFHFIAPEHGQLYILINTRSTPVRDGVVFNPWALKNDSTQIYNPELDQIGLTPLTQLSVGGPSSSLFGYSLPFYEYYTACSFASGQFSTNNDVMTPLNFALFTTPVQAISDISILETPDKLDTVLSLDHYTQDQFICQASFDIQTSLPMKIPSLQRKESI